MVGENPPEPVPEEGASPGKGKFDALNKIKPPNPTALLCSRPNNVISGVVAGVGNTVGSVVVAIGKIKDVQMSSNALFVTMHISCD